MTTEAVMVDKLEQRLAALADTKRIERFVLRFISADEHDLARKKLAKWKPLHALANWAAAERMRKGLDYPYPETDEDYMEIVRRSVAEGVISGAPVDWPAAVYLSLYPNFCGQMIDTSNGYATPDVAAKIVADGMAGRENWCEWVYSCYRRQARETVKHAFANRNSASAAALSDIRKAAGDPEKLAKAKSYARSDQRRGKQAVVKMMLGFELLFASWF